MASSSQQPQIETVTSGADKVKLALDISAIREA